MTKERIKRIHLVYGILLGVSLALAAVCLIVACVQVYHTGGEPYFSREEVAAAFGPISVPVYIALALTVGGALLHLFLPAEPVRQRAPFRPEAVLARLRKRAVLNETQAAAVKKERDRRRLFWLITIGLGGGGAGVSLFYALNGAHFTTDVNASVIQAMWWLLPCAAVPFVSGVFAVYYSRASMQREINVLKNADLSGVPEEAAPPIGRFLVTPVRCALLAVGLFLLIHGFATGGIADVLTKAVNICTECIGLG